MYFKMVRSIIFAIGLSSLAVNLYAEVVIIINPANNASLDKVTLKKIYMGRVKSFADGNKAIPTDLEVPEIKKVFLKQYLQKDQSAIDSYWSRMIFTGSGIPPRSFSNVEQMLQFVSAEVGAIGYIDRQQVNSSVKVVELN